MAVVQRLIVLLSVLLAPVHLKAEIPVQTNVTCPIGGEVFEITETVSCTVYPERTMSFAPTSSCDIVTRLPQCPENFLPLYKKFSASDLELLREYMLTESFDSNVDGSRFYLAYITEKYIGTDESLTFDLLLQGLWYDPVNTYSDPQYMQVFFFEAVSELSGASDADRPFLQAILAFAYLKNGQLDLAAEMSAQAKMAPNTPELLQAYISRIETCMLDPQSVFCQPWQPISAD